MKKPRLPPLKARPGRPPPTGSLTRPMSGISALWIVVLLGLGGGALALPGSAESRRARRSDRGAAQDHGALVRRARPRADPARGDPGGLRSLAAPAGAPRDRRDPLGPQIADRGKAAPRDRAADRG